MGQYDEIVEQQRKKLAAEDWASKVKSIHAHSLSSMYYDDRPEDTNGKSVTDIEYNSGRIERKLNTGETFIFDKYELKGDDLIQSYSQNN
tara:strand:+ start:1399 stop:1668 length:270 start_codon:yes stop_codon:yes gene_type:complete